MPMYEWLYMYPRNTFRMHSRTRLNTKNVNVHEYEQFEKLNDINSFFFKLECFVFK